METEMKQIYIGLYSITARNMKEAGSNFITTQNVFLASFCSDNNSEVDIEKLYNLNKEIKNDEFLNIAYLSVLNRALSKGDIDVWCKSFQMPIEDFRRKVLGSLIYSREAKIIGKKIINIPDNIKQSKIKKAKAKVTAFLYFCIFLKFPEGLRVQIKRILGKNVK